MINCYFSMSNVFNIPLILLFKTYTFLLYNLEKNTIIKILSLKNNVMGHVILFLGQNLTISNKIAWGGMSTSVCEKVLLYMKRWTPFSLESVIAHEKSSCFCYFFGKGSEKVRILTLKTVKYQP